MRYSVIKASIRHWRTMQEQGADMVRAVVWAYMCADAWKKQAEAAEARLRELEQAQP